VTAHLGAGASLCAVVDGRSVDTTMGFIPLEGLAFSPSTLGIARSCWSRVMSPDVGRSGIGRPFPRQLAGIEVLDRYVRALGGDLQIVANFGDEQIKVG